jgi:hypothetical protein
MYLRIIASSCYVGAVIAIVTDLKEFTEIVIHKLSTQYKNV